MHPSHPLAAWSAAFFLISATMPQLAQARELVGFSDPYSNGTVVVKTSERALYYVLGNGKAVRYPVGVGRAGKQWTGTAMISSKQLSPAWSPPEEVKRDKPSLPNVIPGGSPSNPMGAAAMTLSGGGEYAIHGTNDPRSIGGFVSYGCIRMYNEDVQPRQLGNDCGCDPLKRRTLRIGICRGFAMRSAHNVHPEFGLSSHLRRKAGAAVAFIVCGSIAGASGVVVQMAGHETNVDGRSVIAQGEIPLNPAATLSTIVSPASPAMSAADSRQDSGSPSNSPQAEPLHAIPTAVTTSIREPTTVPSEQPVAASKKSQRAVRSVNQRHQGWYDASAWRGYAHQRPSSSW